MGGWVFEGGEEERGEGEVGGYVGLFFDPCAGRQILLLGSSGFSLFDGF